MAPPVATETSTTTNGGSIPLIVPNPKSDYPYEHLLPVFDKNEFYPPLKPFEHTDPAARAAALPESEQRTFLKNATRVRNLTPRIGTEVVGVDLTSLDGPARDQLALEVARRGVIAFRDQPKFLAQTADQLHIHPTSGHPALIPELHLVYRDGNETFNHEQLNRISTTLWHSDVSYELQPPGLTTFFLLAQPSSGGGDTLFVSQVQALKKLSPPFVDFLRTLKAVHSGVQQAKYSREGRRGGVVRRDPVEHGRSWNNNPTHSAPEFLHHVFSSSVVRKHPVTGEEALYVNQQFTTHIVGLKKEESDTILTFLYNHIARVADAQARVNWEPNTVVLWDNRVTAHTAIIDFAESGERRHGARITPQAERPIPALESLELP
ncbi:TauD protein [Rhizoctonia solani]|uniref:TauD protein n=1 Tax=Rhizoctonia solani TaxID=456999 RepID=A0A8H7IKI3_9AGAM|nr:TauD protein [Rhizoctonia solani]